MVRESYAILCHPLPEIYRVIGNFLLCYTLLVLPVSNVDPVGGARNNSMDLLLQTIQLLSQSPGNIVYHLVTLFALQVVFAISYSQARREPTRHLPGRFALAAAGVLITRLLLLGVGLFGQQSTVITAVFPLLDAAINLVTVLLIVWGISPRNDQLPRLADLLLIMGLIISAAMTISFYPGWLRALAAGTSYAATTQATIWQIAQVAILIVGFGLVLLQTSWRKSLAPMILGVMLVTHAAQLIDLTALSETETAVSSWVRLGYLIAFPLWAAMAYRQSLLPLLQQERSPADPKRLAAIVQMAANPALAESPEDTLTAGLLLTQAVLPAVPFLAVGQLVQGNAGQIQLLTNQPQPDKDAPRGWLLTIADWSAIQAAFNQKRAVTLTLDGAGANQLIRFYEKLNILPLQALHIQPTLHQEIPYGVLLTGETGKTTRIEETNPLSQSLSQYLGAIFMSKRVRQTAVPSALSETSGPPTTLPDSDEKISGRIVALENENKQLAEALTTAKNRILRAETRSAEAAKRVLDLQTMVEQLESQPPESRVQELEREVETLRESLTEAEEAMAMASAGEGGLSTEWVMLTITRYSGQLEKAQARIQELETKLARQDARSVDEVLTAVIQELRTPMTSISGFTDLLLAESAGILGVKQRDLVQRIRSNIVRMGGLLDQILQLVPGQADSSQPLPLIEKVNVREAVETAVNSVLKQIREKRIQLDLNIAEMLPPLTVSRHDFHQIMTNLLDNACQASGSDGRIAVSAQPRVLQESENPAIHYIELTIEDSGEGIPAKDLANVFTAHHQADRPLIAGLGDTTVGLNMAHELAIANGGRLWVESEPGQGSIFSVLFPQTPADEMNQNGSI